MTHATFVYGRPLEHHPSASPDEVAFACVIAGVWDIEENSRAFVAFVEVPRKAFDRAGYVVAELVCPLCEAHLTDAARCVFCDVGWTVVPESENWPALIASRVLSDREVCELFRCDITALRKFNRELTPEEARRLQGRT